MSKPLLRITPSESGRESLYDLELPDGRQMLDMTVEEITSLANANEWNVLYQGRYVGYIGTMIEP